MEIDIDHLPSNLPDIIRRLGPGDVLAITEHGCPLAELRPVVSDDSPRRPIGLAAGEFTVPDDFYDPLPEDVLSGFEGDCAVTEALNELYATEPSGMDPVIAQLQCLSLPKKDW